MTTTPHTMEQTTEAWWIGDLCYVMGDVWDEVCDIIFPVRGIIFPDVITRVTGAFTLQDGREFVSYETAYGDGVYLDQHGNEYGVDSGGIGAIRLSDIKDPGAKINLGQIHFMGTPVTQHHSYYLGLITLGTVQIETDTECTDEEGNEDWDKDSDYQEDWDDDDMDEGERGA